MGKKAGETTGTNARRRRWPRRVALLLVLLVLLVALSPLALALPFVRNYVADRVGDAIGRTVRIEKAFAFWGKGIDLEGVTVESPEGFEAPLATVKHLHVDVDLLALARGAIDAAVRVEQPVVTFLKDAAGRSNTESAPREAKPEPTGETVRAPSAPRVEEAGAPSLDVRLEVVDGLVRARPRPDEPYEELADLDALFEVASKGVTIVDVAAKARRAAAGGGDAPIRLKATLTGEGEGPIDVSVPPLDLSRLAGIVEGATGFTGLRGQLAVEVDGRARAGPSGVGRLDARVDGLAIRSPRGVRFAVEKAVAEARFEEDASGSAGTCRIRADHLELLDESGDEPSRIREPLVEITLQGRHLTREDVVVVESGAIRAGHALTVTVSEPWRIERGDAPRAKGQLDLRADLRRLRALDVLLPALASVRGGRLAARVAADAAEGLDVSAGLRAQDLDFAPGALAPDGYREREVVVQVHARRPAGEGDVPMAVTLQRLESAVVRASATPDAPPLEVLLAASGVGARGAATLTVDLEALSGAVGGALGLTAGDRLGGEVQIGVSTDVQDETGRAELTVTGRAVSLPDAWVAGATPTDLAAEATLTLAAERLEVALGRLEAFGLTLSGGAALDRAGDAGLGSADVRVAGDLAGARGLLAPLLGLPAGARLDGRLDGTSRLTRDEGGRTLAGQLTATSLRWQDAAGAIVLDEPRLEVRHDVRLPVEGGRTVVNTLAVVAQSLRAELKGSAAGREEGVALDVEANLSGEAARIAGLLRAVLGEEYRDLKGTGQVSGTLSLRGATARSGADLLVNGTVTPGDWSAGGATLTGASLTARRPSPAEPLALVFSAGVNGGRTEVRGQVRLGEAATPWSGRVKVEKLDTAPLVVDHGLGKYLTYALPTLLPADRDVPVLSGRLDLEVQLAAADLAAPNLERTLQGQGSLRMEKGSIGESTLFRAVGGGRGLGNVGSILARTVPEVGQTLGSLSRSLTFSRVESRFHVANRVLNVQQGLLEGDRTRITFQGAVGFNDAVNLTVGVELSGKGGERLARVLPSRTIPLKVTGTLSKPSVTPLLKADDFAAGALEGLLPGRGNGKSPLDRLRDLVPR